MQKRVESQFMRREQIKQWELISKQQRLVNEEEEKIEPCRKNNSN